MSAKGPRRIGVLGAGPAGLYFALLAKKSDPSREIVVVERNPRDATFGWGVVFSDETMGSLRDADRETYQRILDSFARWGAIDVRFGGRTVRSRGHVFSGTPRRGLLMILQDRCRELGVELEFLREVPSLEAFEAIEAEGFDLVLAADGVNGVARRGHPEWFQPSEDVHGTRFAWYGTDLVFDAFTFIFRDTPHGMFQVHAYPFDAQTSTFIVETLASTWQRAGLDQATEAESMAFCEDLFAEELAGHKLLSNRSLWTSFVTLRCASWHHGNVVLAGDAAHTAHFTIGSGTKLAMEDAIALSAALDIHGDDLERALTDYELERQPIVERFQEAARDSATYFESVGRYASFDPMQFAFNLLTRSGRIGHLELEKRDAAFVARVDRGFQERASAGLPRDRFGPEVLRLLTAGDLPTTPPALEPLALGSTVLWNRLAIQTPAGDDAVDGIIGERHAIRMGTSARSGAGLVLTDLVAVSQEGRICRGTPGIWTDEQAESFSPIERLSEGGPPIAIMLTHAGRRGSMRPRREGADRPLRSNAWEAVAPSAVPLSPSHPAPREATPAYLEVLAEAFGQAARRARDIGFPILLLDMAHGHLLASFLSPLANRRTDAYGGSLESRMRFPMEVFERARAEWPADRPLGVRLQATDWARGGFDAEDAVSVARALRERGCDLIEVAAGQAVPGGQPDYRRLFLVPFADRIRNDAGVVTMVGGNVATRDDVNTILAAGRADLCLVDPRLYASGRVSSAT